jgi:hypothetical protein
MSTLEGWAIPTVVTKYADHTFVYCPDNKQYFACWAGGSSTGSKGAVRICTGTYDNAYAVANCYRDDLAGHPDTAGVGVYGVNGVCHQSANCFLYAAGTHLVLQNGRPGGLLESTAAYGSYGSIGPFAGVGGCATHWAAWYSANYYWCNGKKDSVGAASKDPVFLEVRQLYERARGQPRATGDAAVRLSDLAILIKHAAPGVNLDAVAALQSAYLQEHDGFLRAELSDIPEVKVIDEKSAEWLNALSARFQRSLAQLVGPDQYAALTGRAPDETIELIDPRVLERAQRAATRR